MSQKKPTKLQQMFPEAWIEGYRTGFAECMNDPETRRRIAEEYLRDTGTQGFFSASLIPSPVPASRAPTEGRSIGISATQAAVNKQLGIDEATFAKYAHLGMDQR